MIVVGALVPRGTVIGLPLTPTGLVAPQPPVATASGAISAAPPVGPPIPAPPLPPSSGIRFLPFTRSSGCSSVCSVLHSEQPSNRPSHFGPATPPNHRPLALRSSRPQHAALRRAAHPSGRSPPAPAATILRSSPRQSHRIHNDNADANPGMRSTSSIEPQSISRQQRQRGTKQRTDPQTWSHKQSCHDY